jgi:hypothetical protein
MLPMITTTNQLSSIPFSSKIAKSMYDCHIKNAMPTTKDGENFSFYRKPTNKQAVYISGKSGSFTGEDGKTIQFKPFSGNSVLFTYLKNWQ